MTSEAANIFEVMGELHPDPEKRPSAKAARRAQSVRPTVDPASNPAYVNATLETLIDELRAAKPGERNDKTNSNGLRGFRLLLASDNATEACDWWRGQLFNVCLEIGLSPKEIHDTIESAYAAAVRLGPAAVPEPGQHIRANVTDVAHFDTAHFDTADDYVDLFDARPILARIRDHARARRVSPFAVLGVAAVDAISHVPPTVVLPALVGGRTSLNLFVASVGPSGAGKDSAEAAAREGFSFDLDAVPTVPLGSGEGIARTFRPHAVKDDDSSPVTSAVFSVSEIDTWTALDGRTGSTLTAELRKVYTGSTVGFGNGGKETRTIVAAHSYRACLLAGVQPLRSGPLLDAADGGLPQRFVWLPTLDAKAPSIAPDAPDPITIKTPDWATPDGATFIGDHVVIDVPTVARDEIDAHRLSVLRGDPSVDPLDGHALLTRLKVAAALMALETRTFITEEDWELAGVVMSVSRRTREGCQRALADQASRTTRARAMNSADREEIVSERRSQRALDGIVRQLGRQSPQRRSELRRRLKGDIRDYFDAALAELLAAGRVVESSSGPEGRGVHLSLADMDAER